MKASADGEATVPPANRGDRRWGPMVTAAVLIIGLGATLLIVVGLRDDVRDDIHRAMDQRTGVARSAVGVETRRYLDLLRSVAAGLAANERVTATGFATATAPLVDAGLHGATSVVSVVAAPRATVPQTQSFWRARGAPDLLLAPAANAAEHYFTVFGQPLNGNEGLAQGRDLSPSTEAVTALNEARRTGRPVVSDTYVLLRDRGLPPHAQQMSFAFVAPVFAPAAGGSRDFRGWIVMGLRGQDFLGGVLGEAGQGLLDAELTATNRDSRQVRVATWAARGVANLERRVTVQVADRQWALTTGADSARLPGAHRTSPLTVLVGSTALTLILAVLVQVLISGRSRARRQVQVATAELRAAEAEARRQAGLLGAIMSSLGDGVGVVDGSGAFLLHNPTAKELLGMPDVDGSDSWQQHYGLFRPDGRTPFPVEDLPLVRGLRGESSKGVEMLVRNPKRPEGILISVDGRPLDASAGLHGAVAVFHDITELRRYETDLAAFAGVVAHDLKAPLAVIRGHCELAAEESADAAQTRDALHRITATVDRMASLIDTLLAYTTSRDAPLRLQRLALGALVDEVVADRAGAYRSGDGPVPEIYVGPLPEVSADPAMLRHVLDNLIGNAMKYVAPGRAPHIDITAGPQAPGLVRVEVADRGIGIDDGDKPDVFESFHRARAAEGYAGTGLGLAICRRIVERHGGTIGVSDNPGGGSRFHFTLPLAGTGPGDDRSSGHRKALTRALTERAAVQALADEDVAVPAVPGPDCEPVAGGPERSPAERAPLAARVRPAVPPS